MNNKLMGMLAVFVAGIFFHSNSYALLISGQDIIAAPSFVIDDFPGATNFHQQAFDEQQGVLLTSDLSVDGGVIGSGTVVDSHMIFLNTPVGQGGASDLGVDWLFDGIILGVMSDTGGILEASSSALLGAVGTVYPSSFSNRGLEGGGDGYTVSGNMITVSMVVTEPGDWIRVITAASVPEPSVLALMAIGMAGIGFARRKKA